MKIYIFAIISVLLFCGCSNRRLKNKLRDIIGTEILFSPELECIAGDDSVSFGGHNANQIKLVQYHGPEGCSLCRVNTLNNWLEIQGLAGDKINFGLYIVLCPAPEEYLEIKEALRSRDDHYTVYLDKNNRFLEHNDRLRNKMFRSILLDKNNRVVFVGDPIRNDAMWTLFKSTLDNMLAHDGVYVPE